MAAGLGGRGALLLPPPHYPLQPAHPQDLRLLRYCPSRDQANTQNPLGPPPPTPLSSTVLDKKETRLEDIFSVGHNFLFKLCEFGQLVLGEVMLN